MNNLLELRFVLFHFFSVTVLSYIYSTISAKKGYHGRKPKLNRYDYSKRVNFGMKVFCLDCKVEFDQMFRIAFMTTIDDSLS